MAVSFAEMRGGCPTFFRKDETMLNYKVVAILNKSAGNSEVGDMWQETKVFESSDTINDVILWAKGGSIIGETVPRLCNRLQLQIAE